MLLAVLVLVLTGGLLSAAGYAENTTQAAPTVTTTVAAGPFTQTATVTPPPRPAKKPHKTDFVMPSLIGMNAALAQSALTKAGIREDKVEMAPSDGHAFMLEPGNWTVTGQSIPPGQALADDEIVLTLKKNI